MNRRVVAAVIAAGLTGAALAHAGSAVADPPDGSLAAVFLETGQAATGKPSRAILDGWWGHEGRSGAGTTFVSMDAAGADGTVTDESFAALNDTLGGPGSTDSLRVAFVLTSPDGSAERPEVSAGTPAGEAFTWWTDIGFAQGLNGTDRSDDSVTVLTTQQSWDAFWNQGRRLQSFDDQLRLHDNDYGHALSSAPQGTSILNTWPAGTTISMVLYVSDGYNGRLEPLVKVGPDGHAISAWTTFKTVSRPGDPVRTSAGYHVLTPPAAASSRSDSSSGSSSDPGHGASTATGSRGAGADQESTGPGQQQQPANQEADSAAGSPSGTETGSLGGGWSSVTDAISAAAHSVWGWLTLAVAAALGWFVVRRRRPRHTPAQADPEADLTPTSAHAE